MVRRAGAQALRQSASACATSAWKASTTRRRRGGILSQSIVRDISDRRRAEDELRLVAERLERRVAQRTAEFERAHAELEAANAEIGAANAELQQLLREQERLQAELCTTR